AHLRRENVVRGHHQHVRFRLRFEGQRNVHVHLVAVNVSVERGADQRVKLDRLTFDQLRLERLDAEAVKRRRAVQKNRVLANDLFKHVPNFRALLFDHAARLLHSAGEALNVEARIDERLEQFERHLLRQAALVQLQIRTDDDDRTAGIVDALAEQVLTEAALLALQHVGERLQRTLVGARDDAAAAAVIEQRVDSFLQHPLFVADDDVRRAELHQALQAVVAVDDAAIEIVQGRRRETAAIERHQRTQFRRDHRHDREDHPFRLVARTNERFDQLQTLGQLLRLQLRRRFRDFLAQLLGLFFEIERHQQFADRFAADRGGEAVFAVLVLRLDVVFFSQELLGFERRQARLENDVLFEVQHLLDVLQRHVEHRRDAARQRLQEPDVRDRCGELDVAHALTADTRQRNLDTALFADDVLVLHPLVLAADALVVFLRAEDARAEETVTLGLERAVVDRFRLLDFAEAPRFDLLGARDRNLDLIEHRG